MKLKKENNLAFIDGQNLHHPSHNFILLNSEYGNRQVVYIVASHRTQCRFDVIEFKICNQAN